MHGGATGEWAVTGRAWLCRLPARHGACAWPYRWTALHSASNKGRTHTAKALVAVGADVRCKDDVGYGAGQ
jgi:hypothetical protein